MIKFTEIKKKAQPIMDKHVASTEHSYFATTLKLKACDKRTKQNTNGQLTNNI